MFAKLSLSENEISDLRTLDLLDVYVFIIEKRQNILSVIGSDNIFEPFCFFSIRECHTTKYTNKIEVFFTQTVEVITFFISDLLNCCFGKWH